MLEVKDRYVKITDKITVEVFLTACEEQGISWLNGNSDITGRTKYLECVQLDGKPYRIYCVYSVVSLESSSEEFTIY
jgi:hypothetical protein